MKKLLALLLVGMMIFSLAACGIGGVNSLEAAAREIEKITGEKTSVEDVQEIIDGLAALSDKEVTPQDAVDFVREMYELADDDDDKEEKKNFSASKKSDKAKMDTVTDESSNIESIRKIETNSGLSGIGVPVGLRCTNSGSSGNALSIGFKDSDNDITEEELTAYAAAIWNMCIDIADDNALYRGSTGRTNLEDCEGKNDKGYLKYTWYYNIDGVQYRIAVEISPYNTKTITLWSEKYEG